MSSYFISPPEPTTWKFNADAFARDLCLAWPAAQLKWFAGSADLHQLRWTIASGLPTFVEGALAKNGQTVYLDGDLQSAAAVARWVRSIVPLQQALIFYDEGFSADVVLTAQITEDQLIQPFLAGA